MSGLKKRPTLRTLSQMSGFAVTTISRALAGDEKIAESTRQEVSRIARHIGYVPDSAARRLRTGRTNVIAVVLSPHEEILGFRGSMIAGMQQAIAGTSFHIMMAPYDGEADPLVPIRHILRNRMADGLVFSGTEPDDPRVRYLTNEGFPFVSHGRTAAPQAHAWCDFDNESFAQLAVRRLHAKGARKLFLVPPRGDRTYARHMRQGFEAAVAELGIQGLIRDDLTLTSRPALLQEAAITLCRAGVDGFICPGEVAAMAILAGLQDNGVRIGTDAHLIAKQTSETFGLYRPRIDTIYEDIRLAGETLGQLLLRRINAEPPEALQVLLPPVTKFLNG